MRTLLTLLFVLQGLTSGAQAGYALTYLDSLNAAAEVRIDAGRTLPRGAAFIMPRSIPGTYTIAHYDEYIRDLHAVDARGRRYPMLRHASGAPRWICADTTASVTGVVYRVDLRAMEAANAPSDASLVRPGFAGILLYSVLGWLEGCDSLPIQFRVNSFADWPVFTTLSPTNSPTYRTIQLSVKDYPTLADAQLFLGPAFRVKSFQGPVPFFVAAYGQTGAEALDAYGWFGVTSMRLLRDYMGELPFPHYTLVVSKALQPGNRMAPAFAMEHLQSSTFLGDTSGMILQTPDTTVLWQRLPTYLHHMAHAYIPLRAYAGRYRPRPLEIPPLIGTIWMNEGFMWFIVYDIMRMERLADRFRSTVTNLPPELKALNLTEHSYMASTLYSLDFRTGMGIYARGAMMAMDMDRHIRLQTGGAKGMRDVLRYLYNYGRTHPLPIAAEALPALMEHACGVDLRSIYQQWQAPLN